MTDNAPDPSTDAMASLAARVSALEARADIEALMAQHQDAVTARAGAATVRELWEPDDDVSIEIGASGVFRGTSKVSTFYEKDRIPGVFEFSLLSSPRVEVSADARHARGTWHAVVLDSDAGDLRGRPRDAPARPLLTSTDDAGRAFRAELVWQVIEGRFTRTDGRWRIRRLRVHEMLRHPFDRDWVSWSEQRFDSDGLRIEALFRSNVPFLPSEPPENNPSAPTSWHWQYTFDALPPLFQPSEDADPMKDMT